ncbi:MAG TPA: precorrin-6y C5,15-methyltransferase (decarboxylating) subunit CbiE [Acidimicrobiales bacterium]|nr:precorrin-6y C5,15-methyltransferase (decarboxylating) subunit CbiE [Acidimicrobiales bacterium]
MVLKAAPGTFPPPTAPEPPHSPAPILVVGMPPSAPLPVADLYIGAPRYLEIVPEGSAVLALGPTGTSLAAAFDRTADIVASGRRVCVLAQGDPGFFGVGRALAERFGPGSLEVHPAPSLVSLAFARLGLPWDDAVVVSAQGRNPGDALMAAHRASSSGHKVAVLAGPDAPPERIGHVLLEAWAASARANETTPRPSTRRATATPSEPLTIAVCSRLGTPREQVNLTDARQLARGTWDPISVVLLLPDEALDTHRAPTALWSPESRSWLSGTSFGRDAGAFLHKDEMVNKPEVRAVVLSKLDLPLIGVFWEVGAGGASVAIEAALLAPALEVHAIEEDPRAATQARANANKQSAAIRVHNLHAPEGLAGLPRPDRVFLQGGDSAVLDACLRHLVTGGRVVTTAASLAAAVEAAERLGALVQVGVASGERTVEGDWQLTGTDPVFVAWGPQPRLL